MSARHTTSALRALGLAGLLSITSCQRSIEPGIFIVVRSNIVGLDRVRMQLSRDGRPGEGGALFLDTLFPVRNASGTDIVGSLSVRAPTDRPATQLYVSATALVRDREVVTQRALVTFDPRAQQRLTMYLAAECESFSACAPRQTCTRGPQCVSEEIAALPSVHQDGGEEPLARPPTDAAFALDATRDASLDGAFDAREDRTMDSADAALDAGVSTSDVLDAGGVRDAAQDVYLSDLADVPAEAAPPPVYANSLVVGGTHVCARVSGVPRCWGSRSHGQVGDGVIANDTVGPTRLARNFHTFAVGARHSCALDDSAVYCWGDGTNGALGRAGASATATPTEPTPAITNASSVSAGGTSTCAGLIAARYLYSCWGDNRFGQLGLVPTGIVETPTQAFTSSPAPLTVPPMLGGETHCVRTSRAPWLACAGRNDRYQFGAATPASASALTAVPSIATYPSTGATGAAHACVLLPPGAISCWGDNTELQCGHGAYTGAMMDAPPPPQPPTVIDDPRRDWQLVEAGRAVTCAIDASNELFCWGSNEHGQLGTGSLTPRRSAEPQHVRLPDRVRMVNASVDSDVVCAVTFSFETFCWGDNRWGQLGYAPRALGVAEPTAMPALIPR